MTAASENQNWNEIQRALTNRVILYIIKELHQCVFYAPTTVGDISLFEV
jgi:hypothetical protein|tara:strand:- start:700 stop:846 length:147 start_codon:yes stop_codon:yes gene_type:complete